MGGYASVAAPDASRQTFVLQFGALAPRLARERVRTMCHRADAPATPSDNAALVAGELVTTSLPEGAAPVRVKVRADHDTVVIRVAGPNGSDAGVRSPGAMRRWEVVRRLSRSYGYRSFDGGREVWAMLRADEAAGR